MKNSRKKISQFLNQPIIRMYNWGSGRMVSATASIRNPGIITMKVQRRIQHNDVVDGQMVSFVEESFSAKGGKCLVEVKISYDMARALRSVLEDAIQDAEKVKESRLVSGKPIDLESFLIEHVSTVQ